MESSTKSRRCFTIEEKLGIISRLQNGESNVALSKEFKVSHSTISTMWKNRDKIKQSLESKSLKIKRIRSTPHKDIEDCLLQWFKTQRTNNLPMNGPLLQEKANHFARLLGNDTFSCSESWIYRFRQRHDIVLGKICGESSSVSQSDTSAWLRDVFPKLREGYSDAEIFNTDETGLFFKMTPDRTFKFKGEKCIGGKMSKERITVLVTANMDGSVKEKLLVIGKFRNPRCFKNVKRLPVNYEANRRAWMTSDIFEKFLHSWNSKLRSTNKKVLLLLDNCPAHPKVTLSNIKLVFLPPNCTSVIQPLDQGIIKCLKNYYRKLLVMKLIHHLEHTTTSFTVNVLEAIEMIATAWMRVSAETIRNCFAHAGFSPVITQVSPLVNEFDEMDSVPLAEWIKQFHNTTEDNTVEANYPDWELFITIDENVSTAGELSDAQIVANANSSSNFDEIEESDSDPAVTQVPTINDAFAAIVTIKKFLLFGGAPDSSDMINSVLDIERKIEKIIVNSKQLKQKSIKDFFKPA